jgi:hypothetical protein
MAHSGDRSEEELTPIVTELIKIVSTKQNNPTQEVDISHTKEIARFIRKISTMLLCPPVAIKRGSEGGKTSVQSLSEKPKLEKTFLLSHKKVAITHGSKTGVYMYVCLYVYVCVCMYIYTCMYVQIYMYIFKLYIYTHIQVIINIQKRALILLGLISRGRRYLGKDMLVNTLNQVNMPKILSIMLIL